MKWIKCSERLPDASTEVIVKSDNGVTSATITKFMNNNIPDYYFAPTKDCEDILDNVTHWMPLPEPPNEMD